MWANKQSQASNKVSKRPQKEDPHFTDVGNARRFVNDHGKDAHYCFEWKKWLFWDGKRWAIDRTGEAERRAKKTIKKLFDDAGRTWALVAQELKAVDPKDDVTIAKLKARQTEARKLSDFAVKSEHVQRVDAMLRLARSEHGIPILPTQLDTDAYLLNVKNGTIDLRTGCLRRHRRSYLLTKLAPCKFDTNAACPLWITTVRGILAGDDEMIEFNKRLAGYCLTGCVTEDLAPIFHGDGSNGKTVYLETLCAVMGKDYADAASPDLLLVRKGERHPTEIADLHGKRLVVAQETDSGRELNEALLKRLTGKDELKGRRMREDLWSFSPTHKLIMCTNHRPTVRGQDHGLWRRVALVPFDVRFWRADRGETGPEELRAIPDLKDRLAAEREGILAWMVAGCLDWQRHGMQTPQKVLAATDQYRQHEDKVAAFIAERCITGTEYRVQATRLYDAYKAWMTGNNEGAPLPQRTFGEEMTRKGYKRQTSNGVWYLRICPQNAGESDREDL